MSLVHWHGMTQRENSFMDGTPLNQCLINTVDPKTGKMLSPMNNVSQMTYKITPQASGTWWYHGHYNSQPVDGLAGTLVVEDTKDIIDAYRSHGVTYDAEVIYLLTDWYNAPANSYMPWYLSPESGGDEPMPENIAVNGRLSSKLIERVNKSDKLRVRLVGGTALSMYNVSVDGMPLTVIEVDGTPTVPFDVSYIVINSGQRVSFVLDWSKLPKSMKDSPSVFFRVDAIPDMYPTYDPKLPNNGLFGTASHSPFNIHWTGKFTFSDKAGNPTYDVLAPPPSPAKPPSDTCLLQAVPLFKNPVPPADLNLNYKIEFYNDKFGVNRPHVNGAQFPDFTPEQLQNPPLLQYMSAKGGPLTYLDDPKKPLPKGSWISGSGATPFVLPYKRTIDVYINNTDGGEHPMHLHGHTFWVLGSSMQPNTPDQPILRDTVSVPAQGWAHIRFVADNPGVWYMHCHISWHLEAGLAAYFIEAPSQLKGTIGRIPQEQKDLCPSFFNQGKPSFKPVSAPTKKVPSTKPIKGAPTKQSCSVQSSSSSPECCPPPDQVI